MVLISHEVLKAAIACAVKQPVNVGSLQKFANEKASMLWHHLQSLSPEQRDAILCVLYESFGQSCYSLYLDSLIEVRASELSFQR
jgi:hypothetical protein